MSIQRQFFKPMLSAKIEEENIDIIDKLPYPLMASPKLDGVRATIQHGRVYSRKLKLIPNYYVQQLFGREQMNGLDGELIFGDPTDRICFPATSSAVMSRAGTPSVTFYVFDCAAWCVHGSVKMPTSGEHEWAFHRRLHLAGKIVRPLRVQLPNWPTYVRMHVRPSGSVYVEQKMVVQSCLQLVPHRYVHSPSELLAAEKAFLALGYEGIMLRAPFGPYKEGRSTLNEAWLIKLKRFKEGEARVVELCELFHNKNAATINALGNTQRTSHKAGKIPAGVLGSFKVVDLKTGAMFNVGSGLDDDERKRYWNKKYIGKVIRYRYFPTGSKTRPRIPTFDGFRDRRDI